MATTGALAHSGGVPWSNWAENVGYAFDSVNTVFDLWLTSPGHLDNMLHPGVTHIGIGVVVDASGRVWVSQIMGG